MSALLLISAAAATTISKSVFRGYTLISSTGNESKVFTPVINGTTICFYPKIDEARGEKIERCSLNTETGKTICSQVTYEYPLTLLVHSRTALKTSLPKEKGLTNTYCYTPLDPIKELFLRFGMASIIITGDVEYPSAEFNVTQRPDISHITVNDSDTSLKLYMPFDINQSTTVRDYSSSGNDGTITGATYNDVGYIGGAYEFDGPYSSNAITFTETRLENWTVSAWLYNTGAGVNAVPVFGGPGTIDNAITVTTSSGKIYATLNDTGYIDNLCTGTFNAIDEWYYFAMIKNGTNVSAYKNGVLCGTDDYSVDEAFHIDSIGSGYSTSSWNGSIDEVRIYNRTLTEAEILALYNNQTPTFYPHGKQYFEPINITAGDDMLNLTFEEYNVPAGTELKARIGRWNQTYGYDDRDIPDSQLAGYWHFDENALDSSGQGHHGATSGFNVTNATGKFGGGYEFDNAGINMYDGVFVNNFNMDQNTSFTWCLWAKPGQDLNSTGANYLTLIEQHRRNSLEYYRLTGALQIRYFTFGTHSYTTTFDEGQWYHLCVRYSKAEPNTYGGGLSHFFIDGQNVSEYNNTKGWTISGNNLYLGSSFYSSRSWNGTIDEVMMFNRSLSDAEIGDIYTRGRLNWSYTEYVDVNDTMNFTIWANTTDIFLDLFFNSTPYNFLSPVIKGNITMNTYSSADITAPTVNNLINQSDDTFNWYFGATTSENGDCTLYHNDTNLGWAKNTTIRSVTADTAFNITNITFTQSTHVMWGVTCNDSSGNEGWSTNKTFTAGDTVAPIISNRFNKTSNNVTYYFQAQSNEGGTCTLFHNQSGPWNNNETKIVTANTDFNFTAIQFPNENNNLLWGVMCNDSAGNEAWSTNETFYTFIDVVAPIISNIVNYSNDNLTWTISAESNENASCSLWDNVTSWAIEQTKSVTAANLFNFTAITYAVDTNVLYGVNCTDPFQNTAYSANYSFGSQRYIPPSIEEVIIRRGKIYYGFSDWFAPT